ncbi:hypothetical protein ASPACDRAFT_127002 [Aspergillus aculeatus ATCC 16872]|uniref:Uncharacterized protein n=1 Tax=Aspergillus aculeatus (strain ATCC 16872 / CBS 172.66 / WB 5094) TaxID=690307 RepID=A0A1L9WH91_ASPA1|nr:uncharacterized protein ASPACDRAFT_127002 [Aspergillus aculeatus ATCC 16872]OJJ95530.1 hypothetical protein ASPACDRAFT_127002 [Aspergillus aculeatus ATCC 16872]
MDLSLFLSLSLSCPLIIPPPLPTYLALGMLFMLGSLTSRVFVRSGLGPSERRTGRNLGLEGGKKRAVGWNESFLVQSLLYQTCIKPPSRTSGLARGVWIRRTNYLQDRPHPTLYLGRVR